jgi:hypothetical protein
VVRSGRIERVDGLVFEGLVDSVRKTTPPLLSDRLDHPTSMKPTALLHGTIEAECCTPFGRLAAGLPRAPDQGGLTRGGGNSEEYLTPCVLPDLGGPTRRRRKRRTLHAR